MDDLETKSDLEIKLKKSKSKSLSQKKQGKEEISISEIKQENYLLLLKTANNYTLNSNKAYYLRANKPGRYHTVLTK